MTKTNETVIKTIPCGGNIISVYTERAIETLSSKHLVNISSKSNGYPPGVGGKLLVSTLRPTRGRL